MARLKYNLDTTQGREAFASVKFFSPAQCYSIGYNGAQRRDGIRLIDDLDLYEVSGVRPDAYRTGLIAALLINSEGQIETTAWAIRQIGLLLEVVDEPVKILTDMVAICEQARLSTRLGTEAACTEVLEAMRGEDARLTVAARNQWFRIGYCIVPPPF